MNSINDEVRRLQSLDDEELLVEIGEQVLPAGIFPSSREDLIRAARQWFERERKNLAEKICLNDRVRRLANDKKNPVSIDVLIAAVGDVILGATTGVAPLTVAALATRWGLHSLCGGVWRQDDNSSGGLA